MMLTSFVVYYFSEDSHVKILSCKGNYYLSNDEIYDLAKVDTNSRMFLLPSFLLENRVEKSSFIESCTVTKKGKKISFNIKENLIIGYYISDSKNYALCINGEKFSISKKYLKAIVHFPLISEMTNKQRKQLCNALNEHKDSITRELIEKIAEIVPYKSSYDTNMFKITMQDGNIVYSDLSSLEMLSKYPSVLTALKGQSVCLVLDSEHSAIEKVSCDSLVQKSDEEIVAANKKSNKSSETNETQENSTQQETSQEETTQEDQQEDTSQNVEDSSSNYYYDENLGLYYDLNLGYYFDENGTYYYWDEDAQNFVIVE